MSVAYNWDFSVAYNQDVYLIKKSRFWVCMKTRRVSKRDALVLATLRYLINFDCIFRFFELCYIYAEKQSTEPTKSLIFFSPQGSKDNRVKEIVGRNPSVKLMYLNGLSKNKKSAPLHLNSDFGHAFFVLSRKLLP